MVSIGRRAITYGSCCLFLLSTFFNHSFILSQTLKVLPMGNSITWGTNVSPDPDVSIHTSYRYKLYQLLNQAAYSFDLIGSRSSGYNVFSDAQHLGIPGITDDDLASILESGYNPHPAYHNYETSGPYLNYYPADIILLEIGTNDVMAGDVYDISSEVNRIFNAIDVYETNSGKPVLVFVGKLISTQTGSGACNENALINTYNANLTTIVNNRINAGDKLVMVDLQCSAGINYSTNMLDTYHPNPTGYEKIGQAWFDAINSFNTTPTVSDIPNQSKSEGTSFATINLDNYVTDNEDPDADISWSYSPASPLYLNISIANRIATITPKDPNWNGSETITFIATDKGRVVQGLKRSASDVATFTVTPVNDPPIILAQAVSLSTNEDNYIDLTINNFTVQDVDNPLSGLTLITQSGTNYTYSGNRVYPTANFSGNIKINVVVSDGQAQSNVFQASVDVLSVNDPPSITLPEERSAFENSLYTGVLGVHDVDGGDNLTLTPQTMPSWLNFNATTNTLYGTPLSTNIGNNLVRMRASDGKATVDSSFYIIVINVNHPPVITSLPKTQGDDYKYYSYSIVATDPDNDIVIYTPIIIPDWAQFNSSSGNLSGTPRYFDTGNFPVSLKASDGFEDTTQNFVITVTNLNDKPRFISNPDTIAIMNIQYTYTVEVSDVDEDDILSVSAITIPSWLTYFDQARILIGRPKESNLGKALVAFEVSDGKDVSEQVFYVNVKETSLTKDSYQDENIMVYPNPAESYFTIVSTQGKLALIELYDLKGQCVLSRKLSSVNNEVQVNDFALLPGVYFYKIITSSASCCGKIVLK